jgi:hypothetical protein
MRHSRTAALEKGLVDQSIFTEANTQKPSAQRTAAVINKMKQGDRLRITFPQDYDRRVIHILHDMKYRKGLRFDELSMRYVHAVMRSERDTGHPYRQFVLVVEEKLDFTQHMTLMGRIGPHLEDIQILPA